MDNIDILLLCLYAPFALAALWVVGCLFFGRHDLVPKCLTRWFGGNSNAPKSMGGENSSPPQLLRRK